MMTYYLVHCSAITIAVFLLSDKLGWRTAIAIGLLTWVFIKPK